VLTSGVVEPLEDGVPLLFATTNWTFDNGLDRVVVESSGGRASCD